MPNMITPSSGTMATLSGLNTAGAKNASRAASSTQKAKVLPTKRLKTARARMANSFSGRQKKGRSAPALR